MEKILLGKLVQRGISYGIVQPGIPEEIDSVPVVKVNNIVAGLTDVRLLDKTSEIIANKNKKTKLNGGELLVSVVGTLGKTAIVPESFAGTNINRAVAMVDIRDDILKWWTKYYIDSPEGQKYLFVHTNTGVQPRINIATLEEMPIPLFEYELQVKIVAFLKNIDSKIEINNKINRNLSDQLDALYDKWFGKFKPYNVGVGGDPGYDLEEGWHTEDIYSIAQIIYGAPFKSKLFNTEGDGKPIVRIRDLKGQELCTFTTEEHPKGYLLQPGDVVVGMDGEFKPYIWGNEEAWLNQRVCVFDNTRKDGKAYMYCTIKPLLYSVEATEVATTVIHIGKKDYDEFRVVLPPEDILVKFEAISKPIFDQIIEGLLENRRLVQLRDTLLPKLMSGELDVSELEI